MLGARPTQRIGLAAMLALSAPGLSVLAQACANGGPHAMADMGATFFATLCAVWGCAGAMAWRAARKLMARGARGRGR